MSKLVRIYAPSALDELAADWPRGVAVPGGDGVFAVTEPAIHAATTGETKPDLEELEYDSMLTAAHNSAVNLLISGRGGRRVVVAADVPEGQLSADGTSDATGVGARPDYVLTSDLTTAQVVSFHVDADDATLPAGVESAEMLGILLKAAADCDLLWYDVSEADELFSYRSAR
ncbi:hypothetical protein LWF01_11110 [Saxibacter everestensis]|uniref:Uncharacterized protein n=1 Tax=Saxibacter everestensis TaxID=2909229 RepID=A0ABY8QP08_9MICO|nr:hypothetical protein LWF01_11110 [Brevibacteriaceae bacterium ZFBP1038]